MPSVLANHTSIDQKMDSMNTIARAILPLIFDSHQYDQTGSNEQLSKHLAELHPILQQAAFKNMAEAIEQAQNNLEHKNPSKARELLKTPLAFCLASRPTSSDPHPDMNVNAIRFESNFELAEYHYITQNYQDAILCYDHYLTSQKQIKSKEYTQLALERLLSIYTQLETDPSLAAAYLNEYTNYISHYPELRVVLQQWIHDLNNINASFDDVFQTEKPITFLNIQNYATRVLRAPEPNTHPETEKVKRIVLRGMIFNHLNETTPNEKERPLLLEWLALCY